MVTTIEKRPYQTPKLTVHGSVEKITETKPTGQGDGYNGSLGI